MVGRTRDVESNKPGNDGMKRSNNHKENNNQRSITEKKSDRKHRNNQGPGRRLSRSGNKQARKASAKPARHDLSKGKKRILNIAHSIYHFGWADLDMLSSKYKVDHHHYHGFLDFFIKIPLLAYRIARTDCLYLWFANPLSFIALLLGKLFRKKSMMVSGGYDVVKMKDIDYGVHLNSFLRLFSVWSFMLVDEILLFSKHSLDELRKNVSARIAKEKGHVVYLCGDTTLFRPKGKKGRLAVTLGAISRSNLKRKGLESFVRAARYLPDVEFWLIGIARDDSKQYLEGLATRNVRFIDYGFDKKKIVKAVQKAKVYVQASGHEGFGVSNVEGMLCECVPVVTNRGALPEVVASTGVVVPFDNPKKTADGIKKAMVMDGKPARRRALVFTEAKRKQKLLKIASGLLDK